MWVSLGYLLQAFGLSKILRVHHKSMKINPTLVAPWRKALHHYFLGTEISSVR